MKAPPTILAPLVTLSIAHLCLSGVVSTTLSITNHCAYTVWPALASNGNRLALPTTGFSLQEGESKNITSPTSWNGRVWGRTKCSQNSTGYFSCVTGDCGSGKVECSGFGALPATLAEFALNQVSGQDFFDVSVIDGHNLPVLVTPQGGSGERCKSSGCVIDLNGSCPSELRVLDSVGGTVACEGPCGAFKDSRFCCSGGNFTECKPTLYSETFKSACPRAYSYAKDDANSTFSCGSSPDYQITFCGLIKTSPNSNSTRNTTNTDQSLTNATTTTAIDNGERKIGNAPDKKRQTKILVSSVLAAGMMLLVLASSLLYFWKRKLRKNAGQMKDDIELPLFDFDTVASATNNFCVENKLGQGGYGPVYKGKLKDGQEIAVKTLSKTSRQGQDEFMNEVMHIVKLQHRNLVKLLGCCIQGEEKMLIYEFMPNKSLDFFIFDPARSEELDWPKRYHIINGIARGLLYLHQDSRLRIIHRDLKASNILLDRELNPKISDFGLARSTGGNETEINTLKVAGTYGYIAPEYAIDGLYSVKSDVFSFGVMVLEIVSENRNRGYRHPNHNLNLIGHAWRLFQEGRSEELIAASLLESCKLSEVLRTIHVGLLCVQCLPKDRPIMSSVVSMLTSESELPRPKQPGFFTERDPEEADGSSSQNKPGSVNELTITLLEAR